MISVAIPKYDDNLRQTLKEKEWKEKPSKMEYKKAKKLFEDFKIEKEIPEFNTMLELQRFTKAAVEKKLNEE